MESTTLRSMPASSMDRSRDAAVPSSTDRTFARPSIREMARGATPSGNACTCESMTSMDTTLHGRRGAVGPLDAGLAVM